MTTFAVWCVAGFLWVVFFPARNIPSQWAQLVLGGPLIWATMGVLYWKGTEFQTEMQPKVAKGDDGEA